MAERGLKALADWAKRVTNGYNGVNVKDMSSSFRDGLAFCAIIHHYYPELIDFESLSKENILHNNSLAFSTAEKQLGVPALLDAEDMVKYAVPDRLSVITYLSQLHNCFENQNKANRIKPVVKRVLKTGESGPPTKVPFSEQRNAAFRTHELCQICKHRVFILERLMVSGKLYHRTCFRCCKCASLLKPGAYVESDSGGLYECAVCPHEEKHEQETVPVNENLKSSSLHVSPESNDSTPSVSPTASPKLPTYSSALSTARNSFLQRSIRSDDSFEAEASLASGNSSLSELSSMSVEAVTEETQPSSLDTNESAKEHDDQSVPESPASSSQDSALGKEVISSRKPYQSVFSREIGASLRPLSISRTEKQGSALHASRSPDSARINGHDIPFIKPSTYFSPYSLPRPSSVGNFHLKGGLHSEEGRQDVDLNLRRSSLDANKDYSKDISSTEETRTFASPKSVSNKALITTEPEKTNQRAPSVISTTESNRHENLNPEASSVSYVKQLIQQREASIRESQSSITPIVPVAKSRSSKGRSWSETSNKSVCSLPDSEIKSEECDNVDSSDSPNVLKTPEIIIHDSDMSAIADENEVKFASQGDNEIVISDSSVPEVLEDKMSEKSLDELESSQCTAAKNEPEINPFGGDDETEEDVKVTEEKKEIAPPKKDDPIYPGDLNPFGDDDDEDDASNVGQSYPDTLNPFGDDDDEDEVGRPPGKNAVYDERKNPFADDDDEAEEEEDKSFEQVSRETTPRRPPVPAVRTSILSSTPQGMKSVRSVESLNSPTGSVQGTLNKKRKAPKPPHVREIFQNGSHNISSSDSALASPSSLKTTSPSPKLHKAKRAPPPPSAVAPTKTVQTHSQETKEIKDTYNMSVQSKANHHTSSSAASKDSIETQANGWKKKKRPAPPVPIPPRREIKKIPLKEIKSEMSEIEEKQIELEKQGRDLEELIRDRDKDEEPTVEEEEYIMQLFELVNQKNALFRRQAELMYIKRSQRLEEQQVELEFQIRCLLSKPAPKRTEEDAVREEQLMQQLLDVVDQRNDIIDSIEMERKREAEEDISVQEQTEIKTCDLPITAEIKEKSAKKKSNDKKKAKKDKKKRMKESKNEALDVGKKGTLDVEKKGTLDVGKKGTLKKWFNNS